MRAQLRRKTLAPPLAKPEEAAATVHGTLLRSAWSIARTGSNWRVLRFWVPADTRSRRSQHGRALLRERPARNRWRRPERQAVKPRERNARGNLLLLSARRSRRSHAPTGSRRPASSVHRIALGRLSTDSLKPVNRNARLGRGWFQQYAPDAGTVRIGNSLAAMCLWSLLTGFPDFACNAASILGSRPLSGDS